jgi:hypothetical protein
VESWSRDLGSPSSAQDYPHLLEVKEIVRDTVLQWLREAGGEVPTPPPPTDEPPTISPSQ